MIKTDEDALICDFAETYHVFDWRSLPTRLAATLAGGLRDTSRSKMKLSGTEQDPDRVLLACILDAARIANWQRTKNGGKGTKKPELIAPKLIKEKDKEKGNAVESYDDGAAFLRARERLING